MDTSMVVNVLLFLVFGLVVGLIARFLLPGKQRMSLLTTALLGAAGSFVGAAGWAYLYEGKTPDQLSMLEPAGLCGSVAGAMVLVMVYVIGRSIFFGGRKKDD